MTKPARVTPRGDLIKKLIAEAGYSPEAFANDAHISIKLVRKAIRGEPSTPQTIRAIATYLAKSREGVTFDQLIERTGQPGDAPKEESVTLFDINFRITVAAHHSVLSQVSVETLAASLQQAVSEGATLVVKRLAESHSLDIDLAVDSVGSEDLIRSFCYGRLQDIGALRIRFPAPREYDRDIARFYLERYYFTDKDMESRFESLLGTNQQVTVASPIGLLWLQHDTFDADTDDWHLFSTLSPSQYGNAEEFWNHGATPDYLLDARFQSIRVAYSGDLLPQLPAVLIEETFLTAPDQQPILG